MKFEIIIDDRFLDLLPDTKLSPVENKKVLGLINDYESGEWRYENFHKFIMDNIVQTALSYEEREALRDDVFSSLAEASSHVRVTNNPKDNSEGSEVAEILLYGLMRKHFRALPVVPKIYHKQNDNDFAKGADSVHIVLEEDNQFTLWLGEAKFYKSFTSAEMKKVVLSIEDMLSEKKLRKENAIIINLKDLEQCVTNETILNQIKSLLSNNTSLDKLKPILNVPICILHECPITSQQKIMDEQYKASISNSVKEKAESYFEKQISKLASAHMYKDIFFHIIIFPVPDKSKVVERFKQTINMLRTS